MIAMLRSFTFKKINLLLYASLISLKQNLFRL